MRVTINRVTEIHAGRNGVSVQSRHAFLRPQRVAAFLLTVK